MNGIASVKVAVRVRGMVWRMSREEAPLDCSPSM